jgi:hypothetical protein
MAKFFVDDTPPGGSATNPGLLPRITAKSAARLPNGVKPNSSTNDDDADSTLRHRFCREWWSRNTNHDKGTRYRK